MITKTTEDIKVVVTSEYDAKNSFPSENKFLFRYHITIENLRKSTIKILKRKWLIYDIGFGFNQTSGDGIIGMTPEIPPNHHFSYFSHVILKSGIGNMQGSYLVNDLLTGKNISIEIPKFNLISGVLTN